MKTQNFSAGDSDKQALFESIFDTASDAIVCVDGFQNIAMFNRQAEQLFGYRAEEVIGQPLACLLPKHTRGRHELHVLSFAQEKTERRLMGSRAELSALRKDGSEFPVEISIAKVKLSEERTLFTAIVRDVTERKLAEQALQKAHEELEIRVEQRTADLKAANEELRTFAYIVSHDLRAPLVNLKGFSGELRFSLDELQSLLLSCELPEDIRKQVVSLLEADIPESLNYIELAATRMDQLINAILKLSRLGHQKLIIQTIDLNKAVDEALTALAHQIDLGGIEVHCETLPPLRADLTVVGSIIDNLLSNAIKYSDPARKNLIKIYATHHEKGTTIHVQDQGRGIAEDDKSKVFQIFRRAGTQDVPGEGMGLSYVQAMLRRHGGTIDFVSVLGQGSTFSFSIPDDLEEREPR